MHILPAFVKPTDANNLIIFLQKIPGKMKNTIKLANCSLYLGSINGFVVSVIITEKVR